MAKIEIEIEEEEEEIVMEGFIGTINPPNLEQAGLENCALPAQSIIEAFSRAAVSVKSRIFETLDGGCIHGGGEKEKEFEGGGDDVVAFGEGGGKFDADRVVILGGSGEEEEGREFGGKRGCIVDGDLVPGVENVDRIDGDLDDDDESEDRPVLVGGFA